MTTMRTMTKQTAATYTIEEFATETMAKQWKTGVDLIVAALTAAGKTAYTEEQAKKIVETLKRKEVL